MNVLIIRYNLNCSLHLDGKDQYRIYIKQVSMPLLLAKPLFRVSGATLPCYTNWVYKLNLK